MTVDDLEFREFYAAQYTRLCWLGLLLTGDRAEAEELAQEALVRTWWRWALHRPDDPAARSCRRPRRSPAGYCRCPPAASRSPCRPAGPT